MTDKSEFLLMRNAKILVFSQFFYENFSIKNKKI